MSEFNSLFRVELGPHHLCPGRARHRLRDASGVHDFPRFKALEICSTGPSHGFYLMYLPEHGQGTDGWHETLDDVFHQAEWEFGVKREEWVETNRPF
jgi:hypothetical protein